MGYRKSLIVKQNMAKYVQPPSWEQIESFIQELGVSMCHFELFYGIPYNMITQVKSGAKKFPAKYWHFVYERIKPTYGAGFVVDYSPKQAKNGIKVNLTSSLTPKKKERFNHESLARLK